MKKTDNSQEKVLIGRVGSPVGIRGEFRLNLYAQDSGNLKEGKVLLLERGAKNGSKERPLNEEFSAKIARVRYQKDRPVVKIEGIEDRNAAEDIRGMEASIRACDLEELPEGEHYVRDLVGCSVVDIAGRIGSEGGTEVGILTDVIQNTAQSLLEVETASGRTVLVPAVDAFLRSIDEEARIIEVELIPGFID